MINSFIYIIVTLYIAVWFAHTAEMENSKTLEQVYAPKTAWGWAWKCFIVSSVWPLAMYRHKRGLHEEKTGTA